MPIQDYGVWVANPVRVSAERAEQDPNTGSYSIQFNQNK